MVSSWLDSLNVNYNKAIFIVMKIKRIFLNKGRKVAFSSDGQDTLVKSEDVSNYQNMTIAGFSLWLLLPAL